MWTLLAAALLSGQPAEARNHDCWEQDTAAPCWAGIRALYVAETIEQLQRGGVTVRRIYFLDQIGRISRDGRGHGQQAGMISVEQTVGGAPRLIYHPARRAGGLGTPLSAPIPPEAWAAVLAATAGLEGNSPAGWNGCLHGWEFLVEAADPAADGLSRVGRRRESSCANGPAWSLADRLTRLAVGAFPQCGAPPGTDELWYRIGWLHRCSLQRLPVS